MILYNSANRAAPRLPAMSSKAYARILGATLLAVATLLAITWAITLERIDYEHARVVAQAKTNTANVSVAFEEHTLRTLKSINQTLVLLKHEYLQKGRAIDLQGVLDDAEVDTNYFTVGVFDANGDYVAGSARSTPANAANREFFTAHLKPDSKLYIGQPTNRSHSGALIMAFSRRVQDEKGNFLGVVALSVPPGYFTRFFTTVDLGPEGLLALIGADGVSRVRRVGERTTAGEDMRASKVMAEQARKPHGQFSSVGISEGIPRFIHYRTMHQLPLIVAVGISQRDAMATLEKDRENHLWVGARITFFIIVIAGLLIYALARQRTALDQRERSEARLRAIFEQAFVGMGQHALDGRPVIANQKMADILGYTPEELINVDPRTVVHPDDAPPGGDFSGKFDSRERRFIRKDGAIIWVNASQSLVLDAEGQPDCYVSVVQDITELKRIDRMKTEFVSMVSHELRTPLTSIRGSLGLIAGGVAGSLPDAARNLIDIAKSNCERLIRLINDILDTDKIESGNMHFDPRQAELGPLLQAAVAANEGFASQHGIRIRLQCPAEPLRVNVDSDRLNQVLANLISNAVKFSPAGKAVEVTLLRAGATARIEVRDHGPGIPAEFRARMFQKFSQADSSDARAKGGTGLGLNITKAIVERLGGTIGFDSEVGAGSTFFFDLPILASGPAGLPAVPSRPRVLVCEDDLDIARLIAMLLEKGGFDADLAFDAAQARERAAQRSYAAMTVDLRLPDDQGVAVVRALRAQPHTRDLPIVIVCAFAEEGRIQLNNEVLSVSEWLGKPIDQVSLVVAIREASEGMVNGRPRILHVEDDLDVQRIAAAIAHDFATFEFAGTLREARERLAQWSFDLVLLDLKLPDGSGWDLVAELDGRVPVVVFSVDEASAAEKERVAAVLVKAATSNEVLLDTIRQVLATT
jgi:PAS domain S-box-containing protein